jgi:hypothetical protein
MPPMQRPVGTPIQSQNVCHCLLRRDRVSVQVPCLLEIMAVTNCWLGQREREAALFSSTRAITQSTWVDSLSSGRFT